MIDATQALTILAEIRDRPELERRLELIANHLDDNAVFRPRDLPATHFMRFVIVEDPKHELPSLLVWETNHDGRADDYLAEVAERMPTIDNVFACCVDYPGTARRAEWLAWMTERSQRALAFYTGYRGIERAEVVNDRKVHDAIRAALDAQPGAYAALPPCEVQRQLCAQVRAAEPALDTDVAGDEEWRWALGKLLAAVALIVLLPLLLAIALPWYLVLRAKEHADNDRAERPDRAVHDHGLAVDEDQVQQNQLTHVVDLKPGWFRLATLWIVLTAIDVAARVYSVRGDLGGIVSIHFARWVLIRDRRVVKQKRHRLLFFSNYDGSWESYLGEFIDRAAYGLTAIWSNTEDFPATNHLVCDGARDEEAFKQWTRDHQIPTQVWWSGVPDSTVQNVRDDIWIKRRLDRGLSEDDAQRWLRKL